MQTESDVVNTNAWTRWRGRLLAAIEGLAVLVAAACAGGSILALGAMQSWFADLFTHFALQMAAAALLATALLVWRRRGWPLAAALIAIALNAGAVQRVIPEATTPAPATPAAAERSFRFASSNLFFLNRQHERAIAWARQQQADAIVFVEVTSVWRTALSALSSQYPFQAYVPDRRGTGVLLMSRWPLAASGALRGKLPQSSPMLWATLQRGSQQLRIYGVHATWPFGARRADARGDEFRALAADAAIAGMPVLAGGDFNSTFFSPHYREAFDGSVLREATAGRGWQPTWPTFFPVLGIQIDHIFTSADVQVLKFERGSSVGSDHLPIRVDVLLPAAGPGDAGARSVQDAASAGT